MRLRSAPNLRHRAGIAKTAETIFWFIAVAVGCLIAASAYNSDRWAWLMWVGIAPVFGTIRRLSLSGAVAAAAVWGAGFIHFLAGMGPSIQGLWLGTLGAVVLSLAAYTFACKLFTDRFGYSPLALALGCVGLDAALQAILGWHPAMQGGSVYSSILQLVISFLGYGFLAFVIAYVNALLISLAGRVVMCGDMFRLAVLTNDISLLLIQDRPYRPQSRYLQAVQPRAPPCAAWVHG